MLSLVVTQSVEQLPTHVRHNRKILGIINEVIHFFGICSQVIKFLCIPNSVILNELIGVSAKREGGGRTWKVKLPVVLV